MGASVQRRTPKGFTACIVTHIKHTQTWTFDLLLDKHTYIIRVNYESIDRRISQNELSFRDYTGQRYEGVVGLKKVKQNSVMNYMDSSLTINAYVIPVIQTRRSKKKKLFGEIHLVYMLSGQNIDMLIP